MEKTPVLVGLHEGRLRGLTGAGMWLAGSLGVAAGLGYFSIGLLAAVLGLIITAALGWIERVVERQSGNDGPSNGSQD